jgi:hypothetical protein
MEMELLFKEQGSLACCPLQRSGDTYSFLHKSLQECFAALHMARQIAQWQLSGQIPAEGLCIQDKFLSDDVAVIKFLGQLVDQQYAFVQSHCVPRFQSAYVHCDSIQATATRLTACSPACVCVCVCVCVCAVLSWPSRPVCC